LRHSDHEISSKSFVEKVYKLEMRSLPATPLGVVVSPLANNNEMYLITGHRSA